MFTSADIAGLYERLRPGISRATVNWRVHELVNRNIIARVGRGKFTWGATIAFVPVLTDKLRNMHDALKEHFPFVKYCLWQTTAVKEFNQHIPRINFIVADVEKDAAEAVALFLKDRFKETFYKPGKKLLDNYINDLDQPIVVRHLGSAAPIQDAEEIPTIRIEKLLVDIFSDREFDYLQGNELLAVFHNAFGRYTINLSKLFRYADRKCGKEEIKNFIINHEIALL